MIFTRATLRLDTECRTRSMRALSRALFGVDLDGRPDVVGPALRRR
ncbi:MAG: hypothetical protein JOZ23_15350 [Mycobacterium sp.]|nr:hypothetical protein [Mycobacterium sp.]